MLKKRAFVALAAAAASGLPLMSLMNVVPASASSHREAPAISQDPVADGTDVYAFNTASDANSTTFVANFNPFQAAAGGPNFYRFGDDVKYQIHLDLDGQATDAITLSFAFKTATVNDQTFLYNTGPMSVQDPNTAPVPTAGAQFNHYKNFNRPQVYQVTVDQPAASGSNAKCQSPAVTDPAAFFTPPVNVGPRSVPGNYRDLANAAIATLSCPNSRSAADQIKVFAGQRSDPFFVDLGGAFDLLGLGAGQNVLTGLNVGSIVVSVPKAMLDANRGSHETGANPAQQIVGVWSSASRNATTTINGDGSRTPADSSNATVQVSRLGMPLVNEVVLPLKYKDYFNSSKPSGDAALPADAKDRVFTPELAGLFRALKLDPNAPLTNRQDLAATFLQGLDALKNHPAGAVIAEMIRFDYSTAGIAPSSANRLGAFASEAGFPNGRRLLDDAVDIELLAVQGILCDPAHYQGGNGPFAAQFKAQAAALGAPDEAQCRNDNVTPGGNGLSDGVDKPDKPVQDTFPYLADPTQG
ncbi:MAG: DUF4331 domain-containing protein [Candidatus Dormibacteria bacterium]